MGIELRNIFWEELAKEAARVELLKVKGETVGVVVRAETEEDVDTGS